MHVCFSLSYDGRLAESPLVAGALDLGNPFAGTTATPIADQADGAFYCRVTKFHPETLPIDAGRTDTYSNHGQLYGPGLLRSRRIVVEGELIAKDPAGHDAGLRALRQVWHTEPLPSFTRRGLHRLQWETDTTNGPETRHVYGQIVNELVVWDTDYEQYLCSKFKVELEAPDGRIYAGDPVTITNLPEGYVSGLDLGDGAVPTSQTPMDDLWNPQIVPYDGVLPAPIEITLRVEPTWVDTRTLPPHPAGRYASVDPVVKPTILHVESGAFFQLPITMQIGDNLVIDGATGQAVLNGGIAVSPTPGSSLPMLLPGDNTFVFADDTPFQTHGSALLADITYQRVIL